MGCSRRPLVVSDPRAEKEEAARDSRRDKNTGGVDTHVRCGNCVQREEDVLAALLCACCTKRLSEEKSVM